MRGIHTACPEAPDITVTQNIIQMDGTTSFFVRQQFTGAQYLAIGYLPLDYVPYARSSFVLILNTGVQQYTTDYTVQGDRAYLSFVPQAGDNITVRYFALTDGSTAVTNDSSLSTGMTMGFGGATIPDGWLDMDGSTSHALSAYPALAAWLVANPTYEASRTATHFVLRLLSSTFYDGTTIVSGKTLIKT
jgi:hypothetical protein